MSPKCKMFWLYIPIAASTERFHKKTKFKTGKCIKNCKLIMNIQRIKKNISIFHHFRYLALTIIVTTMVKCFKFPSNKNISDSFCINRHIVNMPPLTFQMNHSSMEPVLFKKLPNIKLSRLIFRGTTFFQFSYTQASLNILLQYAQNLEENIQTLYTRLVAKNDNQKSYEAPQWSLTYVSLLTSCSQELNSF